MVLWDVCALFTRVSYGFASGALFSVHSYAAASKEQNCLRSSFARLTQAHTQKHTSRFICAKDFPIHENTQTCLNGQHNDDNGRNVKGRTLNHGCFFHSPLKIIKSRIQVFKKLLIRLIYLYFIINIKFTSFFKKIWALLYHNLR